MGLKQPSKKFNPLRDMPVFMRVKGMIAKRISGTYCFVNQKF
jgi:hypothetical protein